MRREKMQTRLMLIIKQFFNKGKKYKLSLPKKDTRWIF